MQPLISITLLFLNTTPLFDKILSSCEENELSLVLIKPPLKKWQNGYRRRKWILLPEWDCFHLVLIPSTYWLIVGKTDFFNFGLATGLQHGKYGTNESEMTKNK